MTDLLLCRHLHPVSHGGSENEGKTVRDPFVILSRKGIVQWGDVSIWVAKLICPKSLAF